MKLNNLRTLAIDKCSTSQLNLRSRSIAFSLSNLKWMSLETLQISAIDILRRIELLPTTVKDIDLLGCKSLRNIRGIAGLVNIQRLKIERCPKLDALPSFAQSVSLQEFVLRGCYRVQKIQGLEYCKALEELRADTKWEIQGIDSLGRLERLRSVTLKENRRLGLEGCIQSIQKWPGEILVCTWAVGDAASLVSSFDFPTLSLVDSFSNQKISSKPKLVRMLLLIDDPVMVCFLINCTTPRMQLRISAVDDEVFSAEVEEGTWFLTGLFTQCSISHEAEEYMIERDSGEGEVEKGLLLIGEEQRLVEAFHSLCAFVAN